MRNNKKDNKKKQPSIIHLAREAQDERHFFGALFYRLEGREILRATKDIFDTPQYSKYVRMDPNENLETWYKYTLPDSSVEKSVYWCIGVIKNNLEKINNFTRLSNELTDAILTNNYDLAHSIIDVVESTLGLSLWSINIRVGLYEQANDDSSRMLYINSVLEKISDLDSSLLAALVSTKYTNLVEGNSVEKSRKQTVEQLRGIFDDDEIYEILKYHLLGFELLDTYDFRIILDFEKNSTLIDLFNALVNFVLYSMIKGTNASLITEVVKILSKNLESDLIKRLGFILGINEPVSQYHNEELLKSYTAGQYLKCSDIILSKNNHIQFAYIEIASKCFYRLKYESWPSEYSEVVKQLNDFNIKSQNYNESKNALLKLCFSFYGLDCFKLLQMYLKVGEKSNGNVNLTRIGSLNRILSPFHSYLKIQFLDKDTSQRYLRYLEENGYSATKILYETLNGFEHVDTSGIPPYRADKYRAIGLLKAGKALEAMPIFENISNIDDYPTKLESTSYLLTCYERLGLFDKYFELFNSTVLENKNSIYFLDSYSVLQSAEHFIKSDISIDSLITVSLFSRFIDPSKKSVLRAAFNKIVIKLGIDINTVTLKDEYFPSAKLEYFLVHVATPDIMKLYYKFKSQEAIDNARVRICNLLIQNGIGEDERRNEVKNISKSQVLRKARIQFDASKINVDISDLKLGKNEGSVQLFNSFKEHVDGITPEIEREITIAKTIELLESAKLSAYYLNSSTDDSKNRIFDSLMRQIINEFATGDRGINVSLSTGIRHGYLPNAMRRAFLNEKIIYSKASETGKYKVHDYWIQRLNITNNKDIEIFHRLVTDFSTNIESIIHNFNEEKLQVVTLSENISSLSKKANGYFHYKFSLIESLSLQLKIDGNTTYAEFVSVVENWLWAKTSRILETIRNELENVVKVKVLDCLQNLDLAVAAILVDEELAKFSASVLQAKKNFIQEIKIVSGWFEKVDIEILQSFDLDIPFTIAARSLSISIDSDKQNNFHIKGEFLNKFVDIFYILYENALSKSGLSSEKISCTQKIHERDGQILIRVENNCELASAAAKERAQRYREDYGQEDIMMKRLQGEGGTGFAKIWKIIDRDLQCKHSVDFGYIDDTKFFIEFLIEKSRITVHEDIAG